MDGIEDGNRSRESRQPSWSSFELRTTSEPADVSPDFRSEMAAVRAYYAARIAAARGSLPAADIAASVKALLNEEMIALRALAERWRAATERQRTEKPQRPTGIVQRKDDPKLS
jgi:hypothetical protein